MDHRSAGMTSLFIERIENQFLILVRALPRGGPTRDEIHHAHPTA
jgi:hypothetical protein